MERCSLASCFRRPVVINESMPTRSIALIGDYDPEVTAHRAIPLAVELASRETEPTGVTWLSTEALVSTPDDALFRYAGFWCVPGSPYKNMEGALRAIRFAREQERPFLGTCAGFQHALIEFARSVLGLLDADHQESNPKHPFFFGTQFQPERAALVGRNHPLVAAFVTAVRSCNTDHPRAET
jgi:CTP synthase (UTP-ammonia lyase)